MAWSPNHLSGPKTETLWRPGGKRSRSAGRLHIAAGEGSLMVAELQLAGQKRLKAVDFWHGQRLNAASILGN